MKSGWKTQTPLYKFYCHISLEWTHDRRLIRFKIGESNLILPHYSTCLEIILGVWDSSLRGMATEPPPHAGEDLERDVFVSLYSSCSVHAETYLCQNSSLLPVGVLFWHKVTKMRTGPLCLRYVGMKFQLWLEKSGWIPYQCCWEERGPTTTKHMQVNFPQCKSTVV